MQKGRLEAFTDGVMAIILTIMVLDLKVPEGVTLEALLPLWPVFLSYVLSFAYVGTYWVNHHHMLQATEMVNGPVLHANLNLLFWLSLLPFTTGWMGENHFASLPVAVYGMNLLLCGISYNYLQGRIIKAHRNRTRMAEVVGNDVKGKASAVFYVVGTVAALLGYPIVGFLILCAVAATWFIPDRRMERVIAERQHHED